jgi:hypothetical protein
VIGWLPAETPGDDRDAGLNDFVENRAHSSSPFSLEVSRSGEPLTLTRSVGDFYSALPAAPSQGVV